MTLCPISGHVVINRILLESLLIQPLVHLTHIIWIVWVLGHAWKVTQRGWLSRLDGNLIHLFDNSRVLESLAVDRRRWIISGDFAACWFVEGPLLQNGGRARFLGHLAAVDNMDPSHRLIGLLRGFLTEVSWYLTGVMTKIKEVGIRTFVALVLDLHILKNVPLEMVEIYVLDELVYTIVWW